MITFGGHCFNKDGTYYPDPKVIGVVRGGGVSQQQLGGVAAVKGGVALDRPYIYTYRKEYYPKQKPSLIALYIFFS